MPNGGIEPYHPTSLTAKWAIANLRAKLNNQEFRHDLDPFVVDMPANDDLDSAADLVIAEVLQVPETAHGVTGPRSCLGDA